MAQQKDSGIPSLDKSAPIGVEVVHTNIFLTTATDAWPPPGIQPPAAVIRQPATCLTLGSITTTVDPGLTESSRCSINVGIRRSMSTTGTPPANRVPDAA